MSPFKALYGQDCLVPYRFVDPNLPVPAAKNTLEEMDRQVQIIWESLKKASDRKKSYADVRRKKLEFQVDKHAFLKISLTKDVMRFGI